MATIPELIATCHCSAQLHAGMSTGVVVGIYRPSQGNIWRVQSAVLPMTTTHPVFRWDNQFKVLQSRVATVMSMCVHSSL